MERDAESGAGCSTERAEKIKDRQYRMRAKSRKQGTFEADDDDANADMGAKIEKFSPKIDGSNPITELPGATKAKSSAPSEAPGSGKGFCPIVEKLTREQEEICKQHISELQKRLKDELNVKMDRRWRAIYVETESGELKTRFIAPSGKRLRYIPRCVEYVKREGQPGPDPEAYGQQGKR